MNCTVFGEISRSKCTLKLWVIPIAVLLCFLVVVLLVLLIIVLLVCRNRAKLNLTSSPVSSPAVPSRKISENRQITSSFTRKRSNDQERQSLVLAHRRDHYGANARQDSTDDSAPVPTHRRPPSRRRRTTPPDQPSEYASIRREEVKPEGLYTKLRGCSCRKPTLYIDYEHFIMSRIRDWTEDEQQGAFVLRNPMTPSENVCKVITLYRASSSDAERRFWHFRVYHDSENGTVTLGKDQTKTFDDVEHLIESGRKTNIGLPVLLGRRFTCNLVPGCYACCRGSLKRRNAIKLTPGNRDFFDK